MHAYLDLQAKAAAASTAITITEYGRGLFDLLDTNSDGRLGLRAAEEFPARFRDQIDTRRWGPGERIVFEPYTREAYEAAREWIAGHAIFALDEMGGGRYEDAILAVSP